MARTKSTAKKIGGPYPPSRKGVPGKTTITLNVNSNGTIVPQQVKKTQKKRSRPGEAALRDIRKLQRGTGIF